MAVEIRRGSQAPVTREPGRHTRHAFSFGTHYDPDNVGFGALVCHDEHLLARGAGFGDHPHADVEIVTWVLQGTVVHRDDHGHDARVGVGTAQVLSAGSGVVHSEVADGGPARFVQAWLTPDHRGGEPAWAIADPVIHPGQLVLVASGNDPAAPLRLGTASATFWVARLGAGDRLVLPEATRVHAYLGSGALTRSSLAEPLAAGDAFRITEHADVSVQAAVPTELLVWTFS